MASNSMYSPDLKAWEPKPLMDAATKLRAVKLRAALAECMVEYDKSNTLLQNGEYLCQVKESGKRTIKYAVKTFIGGAFISGQDTVLTYFPECLS